MNELQNKELEILKHFIRVCDELNLKYYLVCGSALGAVKYGGFIPWDDDIDVALPRDDYEKFLQEAPSRLPGYLFLQNYRTDPEFPMIITKIRDSRTTMIESDFADLSINHGICIDVFPLDGYPSDNKEVKSFEKRKKYFQRRLFARTMGKRATFGLNFRTTIIWILYRFFGYCKDTALLISKYENHLASYPVDGSEMVCNHGNWQGSLEYASAVQYGEGVFLNFEGINVRVPEKYDIYLRQKYGDYTLDPPIDKQVSHHSYKIIDVNKSFTFYVDN